MKDFFRSLPGNVIRCFRLKAMPWYLLAGALTAVAVTSGFDWGYFLLTRSPLIWGLAFPAVIIGGLLPILLPLTLLGIGTANRHVKTTITAWALGQAAFIGWIISSLFKAITGRVPPLLTGIGTDISNQFQFGFWRGGIFWGWPSSHTMVAFAVSCAFITLFPKHRTLGVLALLYALYVGIGVSVTVHWFSEFLAGMIMGAVVGIVVGSQWKKLLKAAS